MNNDVLFSIIVPVYNTGKYIKKCLTSIINAIDTDCEVIIINDGSTDDSENIIRDFIEELPDKFKKRFIYKYKENKGLADTKNVGIELSSGKYISVIDSDDYISDDFYTVARRYVNEGYDVIVYDLYIIFENKEKNIENGKKNQKQVLNNYVARACKDDKADLKLALLCGAMQGSSCNKIIKKELYNPYKFPTSKQYEDTAVTPFIIVDAEKIKYVPYPLYYYVQREKSIVSTNTYISAFYKICENISDVLKENELYEKYTQVINEFFVDRTLETLYQDYKKGKKDFNNNIKDFSKKNKNTIKYILDKKLSYNEKNWYSPRQRKLLNNVYTYIYNEELKKINCIFFKRRLVNYLRKIYRGFFELVKIIIGGR